MMVTMVKIPCLLPQGPPRYMHVRHSMYACLHVCTCISIIVCTYMHAHHSMYACMYVCTCMFVMVCMHVCMYVHACSSWYVCMYVCTCMFVIVCMYMYVYHSVHVHACSPQWCTCTRTPTNHSGLMYCLVFHRSELLLLGCLQSSGGLLLRYNEGHFRGIRGVGGQDTHLLLHFDLQLLLAEELALQSEPLGYAHILCSRR